MAQLPNQGFLNDVHYMDDTASAGLNMGASFVTSKTYVGHPGRYQGGVVVDRSSTIGIQCNWTATSAPVGTITIEVSNDGVNFSSLTGSATAVNGAGDIFYKDSAAVYKFVRVRYTRTSGGATDTMVCTVRARTTHT